MEVTTKEIKTEDGRIVVPWCKETAQYYVPNNGVLKQKICIK